MNLCTKEKQTHRLREWTYGCQGKFAMDMHTLLHLKRITKKDLYRRGNSARCHVAAWMGGEMGKNGYMYGLPRWLSGKESAYQCKIHGFNSWVRKTPWRRTWQLIPAWRATVHGAAKRFGWIPSLFTWHYHSIVNQLWVLSCFSHVWFFATLWTIASQAPLSMGFSRQEYRSGLPCPLPGDLPDPGIQPGSPTLQADSLPLSHQRSSFTGVGCHALLQSAILQYKIKS